MIQQIQSKPILIGTARFTTETYNENINWKKNKKWKGACYGFDKKITTHIPYDRSIFVIEMNNTTNQIMGIGLIKNRFIPSQRTRIYSSQCWNAYVYKSKYHISRSEIIKTKFNSYVIMLLERLLFYGSHHFKRGQGCMIVPHDRIATYQHQISLKNHRKLYRCKVCGLPKKNHKCKGRRVRLNNFNKKCHMCGKTKKGHICKGLKRNNNLLKVVLRFFKELF